MLRCSVQRCIGNTAEAGTILTISELAQYDPDVAKMFPDGIPVEIEPPDWDPDAHDEMSTCSKGFFRKWCSSIRDIPLPELLTYHDCIGFMDSKLASRWIGVWMCAAYFATDYLGESDHVIISWVDYRLTRIVEEQQLTIPSDSVRTFIRRVLDPYEDEITPLQLALENNYPDSS